METIRVLQYNVHHGIGVDGRLDLARVADVVDRVDPDVAGLQEIRRYWGEETAHQDQLEQLADLLDADAEVVFGEANSKPPDGEDRDHEPQYGVVALSKYPIESVENRGLPNLESKHPRTHLSTHVDVDGTEVTFDVAHFSPEEADRREQAPAVLERTTDDDRNRVLVGDLNARPGSEALRTLTRRFVDVAEALGAQRPTKPTPWVERTKDGKALEVHAPLRRVDHVLATPDVTPESIDVRYSLASDHCPVVADLTLS